MAFSSAWGHRTDGGLSNSRQVELGWNRLHTDIYTLIHTISQVRGRLLILEWAPDSFYMEKMNDISVGQAKVVQNPKTLVLIKPK